MSAAFHAAVRICKPQHKCFASGVSSNIALLPMTAVLIFRVPTSMQTKQRMLRAFDCFSQALVLLDIKQPGWHVLYANECWQDVTGTASTLEAASPKACRPLIACKLPYSPSLGTCPAGACIAICMLPFSHVAVITFVLSQALSIVQA